MAETIQQAYSNAEQAILQDSLVYKKAEIGLERQLANFSLTNEKAGEIISQFYLSLTGTTIAAAIELQFKYKENERQEAIVAKELEIKEVELNLRKKELDIRMYEANIAERRLNAEVEALEIEKEIQEQKLLLEKERIELEKAKILVTEAQEKLITRQTTGYDDQLLIKVAEFQSGVASNVFNAAPDNPSAQSTIDRFNETVRLLQARICTLNCSATNTNTGESYMPPPVIVEQ